MRSIIVLKELKVLKGEVIKKIDNRGFGFLKSEEMEDEIFFHFSELKDTDFESLKIGQIVEFENTNTESRGF